MWYSVVLTGGGKIAQITIEDLYRGDEYNVMGNAVAELMTEGKEINDNEHFINTILGILIFYSVRCIIKPCSNMVGLCPTCGKDE